MRFKVAFSSSPPFIVESSSGKFSVIIITTLLEDFMVGTLRISRNTSNTWESFVAGMHVGRRLATSSHQRFNGNNRTLCEVIWMP